VKPDQDAAASPIVQALDTAFRYLRWLALLLAVLYLASGVRTVRPEQQAIVLTLGKVSKVQTSGLLITWPYPIDEVIPVATREARRLEVTAFWHRLPGARRGGDVSDPLSPDAVFAEEYVPDKIDPTREGYCITGDSEIIQVQVAVKYRISDPVDFRLGLAPPRPPKKDEKKDREVRHGEDLLRNAMMTAVTHSVGEMTIDEAQGRRAELSRRIQMRLQRRLDADPVKSGVKVETVELVQLHPPRHVIRQFQDVTKAMMERTALEKKAERDAVDRVKKAEADAMSIVMNAEDTAIRLREEAVGQAKAFRNLLVEYRKNPVVVASRLYRETIEEALRLAQVRAVTIGPDGKTTLITDFILVEPEEEPKR